MNIKFYEVDKKVCIEPRISISRTSISFNNKFYENYLFNNKDVYFKIGFIEDTNSIVLVQTERIKNSIKLQKHSGGTGYRLGVERIFKKLNINIEKSILDIKFTYNNKIDGFVIELPVKKINILTEEK